MKGGDYMIHVFIGKGTNLKPEGVNFDGEQSVFDSIIEVECCGMKQFSSTVKDTLVNSDEGHYWGEHFFFEPRDITSDQV